MTNLAHKGGCQCGQVRYELVGLIREIYICHCTECRRTSASAFGHFVMDPKDAAYATKTWLKPKYALPFHYGTFPVLKGTPEEYMKALGKSKTKVFPIKPGDTITF